MSWTDYNQEVWLGRFASRLRFFRKGREKVVQNYEDKQLNTYHLGRVIRSWVKLTRG